MMRTRLTLIVCALGAGSCQLVSGLTDVDVSGAGGSTSSSGSSAQTSSQTQGAASTTGGTSTSGGPDPRCDQYCIDIANRCQGAELQFGSDPICGAFCAYQDTTHLDCRVNALAANGPNVCAQAGPAGYQCDNRCFFCDRDADYFCGALNHACDECDTTDFSTFSWSGCANGSGPFGHCAVYLETLMMLHGTEMNDYCAEYVAGECPAPTTCVNP